MDDKAVRNLFSMRLSAFLKNRGTSQCRFAKSIGVSESTVSAYAKGQRLPGYNVLRDICRETGVSADWWLGLVR